MSITNASSFAPSVQPATTTHSPQNCTSEASFVCTPPANADASHTLWVVALVCSCVTLLLLSVLLHFSTRRIRRQRRELRRAELAMRSVEQQRLEDVMESLLAEDKARRRNRKSAQQPVVDATPLAALAREQGGRMEDIDEPRAYANGGTSHDGAAARIESHVETDQYPNRPLEPLQDLVDHEAELHDAFSPRDGSRPDAATGGHSRGRHRIPTAAHIVPIELQDDTDDEGMGG